MGRCETDNYGLQLGIFPQKYYNRWVVLTFYVVAEAFVGLPFSMGLFSEALKRDLGFTQVNADLVASCGQFGLWQGFLFGLVLESVKSNNQRYFVVVAACCISAGLLYMSLALGGEIPVDLGVMCAVWFFANLGTCIFMTTSYAFNVKNFPQRDRGKICGLAKGTFGLSSSVLAILLSSFFKASFTYPEAKFSLFLACVTFVFVTICAIPANLICPSHLDYVPEHAQGIVPSFRPILSWFYGLLVILAAFTCCALAGLSINHIAYGIVVLVVTFCAYAIPTLYGSAMVSTLGPENMPMPADSTMSEPAKPKVSSKESVCDVADIDSEPVDPKPDAKPPPVDVSWYRALLDLRFWAVFISFFVGAGSGLTLFNNVTAIATSLNLDPDPEFVSLMGLGNSFARLYAGVLSDILHRYGLPRSFILFVALAGAAGNNFLLSLGSPGYLYLGLILGAMCFGSLFSTILGLMADYFGTKDIAITYGLQDVAPATSSFAISTALVSVFYKSDDGGNCIGRGCFQNTFIIIGIMSAICVPIVFFILVIPDYKRMREKTTSTEH